MPSPMIVQPILTPTVEMALDRFAAEWPIVWLVYGDESLGWKDPHVSHVFVRIDGLRHVTEPEDRFREYQVHAVKVETAIARAVELIESPFPLVVTLYRVQMPPTAEQVGFLEAENARIQRDPARGRSLTGRSTGDMGARSRQPGRDHLSPAGRWGVPAGV